ncbi:ABC transporter ATP-binding protein [Ruminococcus sp.]|uniref:ATP-binding cassette domain-containing protein n=1 Tax=Ruminococcus sp. TaxID=41978 RepID=UPI0025E37815|nr:ABC transporter ATP-binding protein [Ruminococcus sp.]MBR1433384.1 ABC transporter ATP-binding protein [Ruminococcus sp.]
MACMILPIIVCTLYQLIDEVLVIFSGDIVGKFSDAALNMHWKIGMDNIIKLSLVLFIIIILIPLIQFLCDQITLKKALVHNRMIFTKYLECSHNSFDLNEGETQFVLEDAPNTMRLTMLTICSNIIVIPIGVIYLIYNTTKINIPLSVIMLTSVALKGLIPFMLKKKLEYYNNIQNQYQAKRRSCETDITQNAVMIKLIKIEESIVSRVNDLYYRYHKEYEKKYLFYQSMVSQFKQFYDTFIKIVLILIGSYLIMNRNITPGQLLSMIVYISSAQKLFGLISEVVENLPSLKNSVERVSEFYENKENNNGIIITKFESLSCRDVIVYYDDKPVLNNVSVNISKGDKVCLTGENGCGKSTLAKLIIAEIEPKSGSITINGINRKDVEIYSYRKLISYASQQPFLFRTTVRENIAIGDIDSGKEKVNEVAKLFGLESIMEKK